MCIMGLEQILPVQLGLFILPVGCMTVRSKLIVSRCHPSEYTPLTPRHAY